MDEERLLNLDSFCFLSSCFFFFFFTFHHRFSISARSVLINSFFSCEIFIVAFRASVLSMPFRIWLCFLDPLLFCFFAVCFYISVFWRLLTTPFWTHVSTKVYRVSVTCVGKCFNSRAPWKHFAVRRCEVTRYWPPGQSHYIRRRQKVVHYKGCLCVGKTCLSVTKLEIAKTWTWKRTAVFEYGCLFCRCVF